MTTPLGRPVVPDVNRMSLVSPGCTRFSCCRAADGPTATPLARKSSQLTVGMRPSLRGRVGPLSTTIWRRFANGVGSSSNIATVLVSKNPTEVHNTETLAVASTNAASPPFQRVLIGTSAAPAHCAPSAATIQPRQFGAHTATRSPGPTPAAIIACVEATIRSPSSE